MFNEAINKVALGTADTVQTVGATDEFAAKLTEGASVAVVGIGIVFLILALLWIVLELFKLFFYTLPKKRSEENTVETAPATAAEPVPAPAPTPAVSAAADDGALIAAITAAITAYRAAENNGYSYTGGFRVVSFKRK